MLFLSIFLLGAGYFFLYIGIKGQTRFVHAPWLLLVDEFKGLSLKPSTTTAPKVASKANPATAGHI